MNKDFNDYFEFLISPTIEGGYVNDKYDPGGETKYGISKRSFPNEDIPNLTKERAKELYYEHYWLKSSCDKISFPNNIILFDLAVNSGYGRAIKILQKSCNVTVDGIVGPKTIHAANNREFTYFLAERAMYYASISQFPRYGRGWSRRLFNICIYICQTVMSGSASKEVLGASKS